MMLDLLSPNWPALARVKAYTTTRKGGFSQGPFTSFNLRLGGDDDEAAKRNRQLLADTLKLPNAPVWLAQVHGTNAVPAELAAPLTTADASYTFKPNTVCAVLTADCLPVLVCNRQATCVAAIHAGWRGLAAGVIEATLQKLNIPAAELLVWLGPAIGPDVFEVGDEVRQQFIAIDPQANAAFLPHKDRWLANIYLLAKQRLTNSGVTAVYGGEFCTLTDKDRFYSFRREPVTGRMASLIWLEG